MVITTIVFYSSLYTIPYQIYKGFPYVDILKDFPIASRNSDVLTGSFPTGSGSTSQVFTYWPLLGTTKEYPPFGSYSDNVIVSLYEGTVADHVLDSSQ